MKAVVEAVGRRRRSRRRSTPVESAHPAAAVDAVPSGRARFEASRRNRSAAVDADAVGTRLEVGQSSVDVGQPGLRGAAAAFQTRPLPGQRCAVGIVFVVVVATAADRADAVEGRAGGGQLVDQCPPMTQQDTPVFVSPVHPSMMPEPRAPAQVRSSRTTDPLRQVAPERVASSISSSSANADITCAAGTAASCASSRTVRDPDPGRAS